MLTVEIYLGQAFYQSFTQEGMGFGFQNLYMKASAKYSFTVSFISFVEMTDCDQYLGSVVMF